MKQPLAARANNGLQPDREQRGSHPQDLAVSALCARRVMPGVGCYVIVIQHSL
jgi:hypothetical protein